jgi:prepilin-type processing-associated H-X9-DG protein
MRSAQKSPAMRFWAPRRAGPPGAGDRQRRGRGLTIVEIVAVLAIIALMLGILAPALASSRARARSLRCQSNLKQMAAAAYNYAALYDAFPAAIRYETVGGVIRTIAWDWITSSGQPPMPGPLWTFTTNPDDVQQCPDFNGASTFAGDPYTGYNYNTSFIGAEAAFPSLGWSNIRKGVPPAACSRACDCAMFGDGGWRGGANKFMRSPLNAEHLPIATIYSGGQAFRHRHATNIAFVDGHVRANSDPRKGQHQTEALLTQYMNFPRNGFLSDDDRMYNPR